jgi:nucleotidyltransferase substrate binding protein (TIGR01987 family)
MAINVEYLERCIATLERGQQRLLAEPEDEFSYDLYRAACVKEFELVLEQSGKLLKKQLAEYFASNKAVDRLTFKDIFRHATKHDLLSPDACERWMQYRDNRNDTAHDYGEKFAESTLALLPAFIEDARNLVATLKDDNNDNS